MAQQYTKKELEEIGRECGNRLPPASSVEAMFLYEMRRDTELERLFQGALFQFDRAKESQDGRVSKLLEDFEGLKEEVASKDVDKRLSLYKIRMDGFQLSLNEKSQQIKSLNERLASLKEAVKDSNSKTEQSQTSDAAGTTKKPVSYPANLDDVKDELNCLNEEVTLLFEERDAVAKLLEQNKARTDEVLGHAFRDLADLMSDVNRMISKVEKEADERLKRLEGNVEDGILEKTDALRAEAEKAKGQSFDHITKVEKSVISLSEQSKKRDDELDQNIKKQIDEAEKKIYSRILNVERQLDTGIENVSQKTDLLVNQIGQQFKEQNEMTDQKSNLLIGEVGKYKWLAEIEKEKIDLISDSVNVMNDRLTKSDDQIFELTAVFRAREKEQNDRIAKLEDLVRALTAQSPNESPPPAASQLLQIRAPNGQALDLSVPKGQPLVPYKKENIRTFTPGKQWMNSTVEFPDQKKM